MRRASVVLIGFLALSYGLALASGQAATPTLTEIGQEARAATGAASAAADPVLPDNPNPAMQMVARVNGLGAADMKPWHLKATFQTFNPDGKPQDTGTFEEWWVGPEKYKRSYSSSGFTQVLYWNAGRGWITGETGWAPQPEAMVEQYLIHPLPSAGEISKESYFSVDQKMGKATFKCIKPQPRPQFSDRVLPASALSGPWIPALCVAGELPAIRVENLEEGVFVFFDQIFRANGQYVAKQILVENLHVPIVKMSVTQWEGLSRIDEAEFAPPASAVPAPVQGNEKGIIPGYKISGKDARFSEEAKNKKIQGTVILEMVVRKTGDVSDLQVVSGRKELRQPALDAVKTWKFEPFRLNGEPVDAKASVDVSYSIW